MKANRRKVIPNNIFSKLWKDAEKIKTEQEFLRKYSSTISCDYINFKKKYELEYEETLTMLREIYRKQNMSFKEITDMALKRKCEIAETFSIPIRTVEDWYSGRNKCPSYIRLMILRYYFLIDLGKYIYTEYDVEHNKNKPAVYKKAR